MSTFDRDLSKEQILSKFLDKAYSIEGLKTERIIDLILQKRGIDIILMQGEKEITADEKAQLSYLNKSLPTFALEINYYRNQVLLPGWLFDKNKINIAYAFIFSINLKDGKEILTHENDISSCEIVWVYSERLVDELNKLKFTEDFCLSESRTLRANINNDIIWYPNKFKMMISRKLVEEPVNLIVRKEFLVDIGFLHIKEARDEKR